MFWVWGCTGIYYQLLLIQKIGSYQNGSSDTECINIYGALSFAFVSSPDCPLTSFLLNAVQHFAHSPLAVWTAAEENNDQTKSPVHVLHKRVGPFLKGGAGITPALSKA